MRTLLVMVAMLLLSTPVEANIVFDPPPVRAPKPRPGPKPTPTPNPAPKPGPRDFAAGLLLSAAIAGIVLVRRSRNDQVPQPQGG